MSNKKSIVFVNQSSGYLMIDIINQHVNRFDEIILLTGFLNPRNQALDKRVKVHYLKSYEKTTFLKRFSSWLLFTIQCLYFIFIKYRKSVIYFVSNPPITVFLAYFLKREYTFLIYDVYPDVFVQYGILNKNSLTVKLWKKINIKTFQNSKAIFTIGSGMKKLLSSYTSPEKIKIIPIWTDNTYLKPIPKEKNTFLKENKLTDTFNIIYSGNLGITHPLEVLLELAEELIEEPIKIIIIGDGKKRKKLENLKVEKGLDNVIFLPYQPMNVFPYSLAAADIGVVTLDMKAAHLSVPSKTFNLMSVGVPILCITGEDSELKELINRHQNGKCFKVNQKTEMVKFIKEIREDRKSLNILSENSFAASMHYTPSNAVRLLF